MDQATHNKIVSFIWGIADDVLRDLFRRGKYPDVILPMCVLRRLDAVLEPTKKAVLEARSLLETANTLRNELGGDLFEDHNVFRDRVTEALKKLDLKVPAADLKQIFKAVSWREESAPPVIGKVHKPGKAQPNAFHGRYEAKVDGKACVVEYETDSDLRDTEQVPLLEEGGIEAFITREVLPYTPDAWVKEGTTKIGYEISFTRHFYKPQPLRSLDEIRADMIAAEQEAEGVLDDLLKGGAA